MAVKNSWIGALGALTIVAGCSSTALEREAARQREQPNSIQAAILYGEEMNAFYTGRGSALAKNRRWMSLGILAANTYVLAAAGLDAHPDSVFAGALVASTLHNADPILNAGGPDAWSAAHARTVCVVAVAGGLNTNSLFDDIQTLRSSTDTPEIATALQRYDAYPARLAGVIREIHARYLRDTTPELPAVNPIADRIINERTARQNDDATETLPDTEGARTRLTAAFELADAALSQCRPPTNDPVPSPSPAPEE